MLAARTGQCGPTGPGSAVGAVVGERGGPGGDAAHKALGRTPQPKQALPAAPQRGEALLCHRVRGGGGSPSPLAPAPGSPWLPRRVGRATRAIGPGHGTPAQLYMTGRKETTGKLDHYEHFCFSKNYNHKPLKKTQKSNHPLPPPFPKSKKYFFLDLAGEQLGWGQAWAQEP